MNSRPKLSKQEVQDTAKKITALNLSIEDEALLLAGLYMTNSRVEEATEILKTLINDGTQDTGIHRILGDIYLCANQPQLAQNFYEEVMNLSAPNRPCAEKLAAKAGLIQLEAGNRIKAETERLHQDIENEFDTLSSDRQMSAIAAAIKNIESRDRQLAELLTSLTTDCPIKGCRVNNEVVKSSRRAICMTCVVD